MVRNLALALTTCILMVAILFGIAEFALRRGVIVTTSYLRWVPQLASGTHGPRILILGDSFLARQPGGGDTHSALYARLAGSGVQIVNPSRAGIGPYQYLELLLEATSRFSADLVLLAFYVGNDLMDVGCKDDVDIRLRKITTAAPPSLLERSFVLQHLESIGRGYLLLHPDVDWASLEAAGIPKEDVERARRFEINPYVVMLGAVCPDCFRDTLELETDCARRAWANTQKILDEILRRAAAAGARVVPVIFPHTLQVSPVHHDLYRRWKITVDHSMLEGRRPQDLLLRYYQERGIPALDLLPVFKAATAQLYFDRDEHLAPAGDRLAAQEIARFLGERGLVRSAISPASSRTSDKEPPASAHH
jgi:hypothetical protein